MSTRKRSDLVSLCFYGAVLLLFIYNASAFTDPSNVKAMEDFYGLLNQTTQLTGWTATGGDPCGRNWRGVSCSGFSITSINISGLGLGGTMSSQLSSLLSLTQLDMSYNNISGDIPFSLPPNAILINLAANKLVGNIPLSLPYLKHLKHLNVSSNNLSGIVGNVFTDMTSLEKLDLSFNSFSGDLPSSFGSLQNLHSLHLQHNQFTGSVNYLANLPLTDLNIENNNFSGYVPKQFEVISELRMEGNQFEPYFLNRTRIFFPPLPSADQNVSHTPIVTHEVLHQHPHKKSKVAVALAAAFSTIFVTFAISLVVVLLYRRFSWRKDNTGWYELSPSTLPPCLIEGSFFCFSCGYTNLGLLRSCVDSGHSIMDSREHSKLTEMQSRNVPVYYMKHPVHGKEVLVVNVDASYIEGVGAGLSVILRNGSLEYIYGYSRFEPAHERPLQDSSTLAEADAICWGIKIAYDFVERNPGQFTRIVLYSDSRVCVESFKTGETNFPDYDDKILLSYVNKMRTMARQPIWDAKHIMQEPTHITNRKPPVELEIKWIAREMNGTADAIASLRICMRWPLLPLHINNISIGDKYLTRFCEDKNI